MPVVEILLPLKNGMNGNSVHQAQTSANTSVVLEPNAIESINCPYGAIELKTVVI